MRHLVFVAIRIGIAVPLRMGTMPQDQENGHDRHYVRSDQWMSRRVYRAQLVRTLFGKGVALFFMRVVRVKASVAQRVLRSQRSRLRR